MAGWGYYCRRKRGKQQVLHTARGHAKHPTFYKKVSACAGIPSSTPTPVSAARERPPAKRSSGRGPRVRKAGWQKLRVFAEETVGCGLCWPWLGCGKCSGLKLGKMKVKTAWKCPSGSVVVCIRSNQLSLCPFPKKEALLERVKSTSEKTGVINIWRIKSGVNWNLSNTPLLSSPPPNIYKSLQGNIQYNFTLGKIGHQKISLQ